MHPSFLRKSIEQSLERLNLDCLDVCYLHNPYEAQAPYNIDNVVYGRIEKAFELLETMV